MNGDLRLIIGTAGHVDHGKTQIVKALTGRDTDRLREEKERGISIVLGFAPIDLGEGMRAGIVDVPGHERFVKTMVSGAVGMDLALLVVAADEGIMPQTEEHFEVLRLLGVKGLVVALTKIDLVEDEELIELVENEIGELLAGTPFESSPVVRTSSITGQGLDELRRYLREKALELRRKESEDFFRMPVDRSWTRSGIGTIVTGTAWSGEVRRGDELVLEPLSLRVRVREVQSFDRSLEKSSAGMRTALALHGVRVEQAPVGSQILSPGFLSPSNMIDARMEISRLAAEAVETRERIRFHHAAKEILGRVVIIGSEFIEPGSFGYVQFRLEEPAVARRGDGFIVRSYSPQRVIAGGKVLDPVPMKFKLHDAQARKAFLESLDGTSAEDVVLALAARAKERGFPKEALPRYGLRQVEAADSILKMEKDGKIVFLGGRIFDSSIVSSFERFLRELLSRLSSENPLEWGVEREELKYRSGLTEGPLFDALVERGLREGVFFAKGSRIKAGGAQLELSKEDLSALEKLSSRIASGGYEFVTRSDLKNIVADEKQLVSYLRILVENGTIVRIADSSYLSADSWRKMVDAVRCKLQESGSITVADAKELFGFSRKFAVPILEFFDREGLTVREGDSRKAGPKLCSGGQN